MEVILLEQIKKLGKLGQKVVVKPGYGRNFLVPFGKAIAATKDNLAAFESRRLELEKIAQTKLEEARQRAERLIEHELVISERAGDEGKLYGSIGTRDLAEVITKATGVKVDRREIRMPHGSIRQVGQYDIDLNLHSEINVKVRVLVEAKKIS